jgi:bifunctional DNA-binding transcriptional regulator/antitoxin component of YhaV-PrlF toxin-antitoxin module
MKRRFRMVYIEKKGKAEYAYGWSKVGEDGRIVIPPEAVEEYSIKDHGKVMLMPRHKLSGGFELILVGLLTGLLGMDDRLAGLPTTEGKVREIEGKPFCWVRIRDGGITVPVETLAEYLIHPGDLLLSVRGNYVAPVFLVKGPIVKEAKAHELPVYE